MLIYNVCINPVYLFVFFNQYFTHSYHTSAKNCALTFCNTTADWEVCRLPSM